MSSHLYSPGNKQSSTGVHGTPVPSARSLIAQLVKNLPATQETPVQSLRQEDPLEEEMVGWHHRLNGHEFEQIPGDGEQPCG